jgi:hypothetical protein
MLCGVLYGFGKATVVKLKIIVCGLNETEKRLKVCGWDGVCAAFE